MCEALSLEKIGPVVKWYDALCRIYGRDGLDSNGTDLETSGLHISSLPLEDLSADT